MKKSVFKKIFTVVAMSAFVISFLSIWVIRIFASETTSATNFIGYPISGGEDFLENATNTSKNTDGSYTNPVSTSAPQITVLIPGFDSEASTWSNNYRTGVELVEGKFNKKLSYNSNSLVEKLRDYADANIYYADVTTTYEDVPNEYEHIREGEVIEQNFVLYEYPDLCTTNNCNSCMFEEEYAIFEKSEATVIMQITDISKHIVVLFEPKDPKSSNEKIYQQLNYVIDKIVYDVKVLNNGVLPRINLVGHSRGGLTAMQYALDHPYLVDSLISIGTPYSGTYFGQEAILNNFLGVSADPSKGTMFAFGAKDILDENIYNGYRSRWNQDYEEKYSHINFHAIAGVTSIDGVMNILEKDPFITEHDIVDENLSPKGKAYIREIIKHLDDSVDIGQAWGWWFFYNERVDALGDLFIDYDSQCAVGYLGVTNYTRFFEPENMNFSMLATANVAIPHNLEPGDATIHKYILKKINVPIYGAKLSIGLIQVKLKEHKINNAKLNIVSQKDIIKLSHMEVEFIKNNLTEVFEQCDIKSYNFYSLLGALIYNRYGFKVTDEDLAKPQYSFCNNINIVQQDLIRLFSAIDQKDINGEFADMVRASSASTHTIKNRKTRFRAILEVLQRV